MAAAGIELCGGRWGLEGQKQSWGSERCPGGGAQVTKGFGRQRDHRRVGAVGWKRHGEVTGPSWARWGVENAGSESAAAHLGVSGV